MNIHRTVALCASVCVLCIVACDDDDTAAGPTGSGAAGATTGSGASTSAGGSGGGSAGGAAGSGGGGAGDPQGYEGFGAVTQGHDSCATAPDEVHVTNLDDNGSGSLREALSAGCRRVVFDMGGTITLASDLNIPHSYITIDGRTAPTPGITIEQPGNIGTTIEAGNSTGPVSDIIITHLRMDGLSGGAHTNVGDIWGIDGEANPVSRIIIDHVTGTAATDGVFDVWEEVTDVTLSYNLITDTVTMLHLSTGDISVARARFSIHHNVFARNNERQIRIRHDNQLIDYVNNVIYGWGWIEAGGAGIDINHDANETNPSMNIIANVFHHVGGTNSGPDDAIKFARGSDEGTVFFEGNVVPTGESDNASSGAKLDIPASAAVTQHVATELATAVVPNVGTHYPTTAEQSLLQQIAADVTP